MAPSKTIGISIKFASKPSSVIVAFSKADDATYVRYIIVIDIKNGMCLIGDGFASTNVPYCNFDEMNNELTIYGHEGINEISFGQKAIVIPLYSTDLP